MDMTTTQQLAEATANRDAARIAFQTATTSKARREADEELNFWMGKVVAAQHTLRLEGAAR